MNKYSVYVLINPKNQLYIGWTSDINKRIDYHNRGSGGWTKNKGPWKLLYKEYYNNKNIAIKRERYLKTGIGRKFLKELIK